MRLALVTSLALCLAFTGYGPLSGLEKQTPVFEVATIKLNKSGSRSSYSSTRNGHLIATNILLKNLMQYEAYGIPGSRILGGPKWLDSTRFDLEAKMDDSTANRLQALPHSEQRVEEQAMVQQLLADRFRLAVHRETRELPVYALVAAKNGPKLQPENNLGRLPYIVNGYSLGLATYGRGCHFAAVRGCLDAAVVSGTRPGRRRQNRNQRKV